MSDQELLVGLAERVSQLEHDNDQLKRLAADQHHINKRLVALIEVALEQ